MKAFNFYKQDEGGYDVEVQPEEKAKTVQEHIEKYDDLPGYKVITRETLIDYIKQCLETTQTKI